MSYKQLQQTYIWLIRIGLFGIPFLSLYISSGMLFPYITGRNFYFRIIVEAVFLLWIGLMILDNTYRPRSTKLLLAVFAFMVVVAAADFFGANPYRSFFSNYERMEGYLMILHLGMLFMVLTSVFKSRTEWLWYFGSIVSASVFIAFYALFQKFGVFQSLQGGVRVDGTIGNPAYLAAYLMMTGFLSLFLFLEFKKYQFRYAFLLVSVFELMIIYFTATRGVTVALLGGGPLFLVLYLFLVPSETEAGRLLKKISVVALLTTIVVPIAIYLAKDTKFVITNPTLSRLTQISLSDQTIRSRFMIWGMAWQAVKERPVLGWGQENFNIVFSKFYNPKLFDQEPWFDRSHDIIFDWMVNAGIVGLISYLMLYGMALVILWQAWRRGRIYPTEAILFFVAFACYFVQDLFVFDNMNTYYIFFGMLAYINSYEPAEPSDPKSVLRGSREHARSLSLAIPKSLSIVIALGLLMAVFAYVLNVKPLRQSQALISALRMNAQGANPADILSAFKFALSYNSLGNSETREQLAQFAIAAYGNSAVPDDLKRAISSYAVGEIEKQVILSHGDVKYRLFLASLYMRFADTNPDYIQKAELTLLEGMKESPTKQPLLFTLAQYYYNTGQGEKALEISQRAADLAPGYMDAQANLTMIALYLGRKDIAEQAMKKVEEAGDNDHLRGNAYRRLNYPKIIGALQKTGDYAKIVVYYKWLANSEPNNIQHHVGLAYSLAKTGDREGAKAEARKAAELDPKNYGPQVDQFIQFLDSGKELP